MSSVIQYYTCKVWMTSTIRKQAQTYSLKSKLGNFRETELSNDRSSGAETRIE